MAHWHTVGLLTPRLAARVERDFPEPGSAAEVVRIIGDVSESERIQAAIVLFAHGDVARLLNAAAMARQDWRDALVRAGLADDDWQDRLLADLGPVV